MFKRNLYDNVLAYLQAFPIVALLGARQCGKSTLAKQIIQANPTEWVYLDLERPSDLQKLHDPELFFTSIGGKKVCIDEVQLRPDLFSVLRSIVDEDERKGKILLLGSASPELLRQGSETLAGRISFLELTPFVLEEINTLHSCQNHWLKGGFPRSLLAPTEELSYVWREDFLKTYVERDLVSLDLKLTSSEVLRLLTMCAHSQGQLFNASKLSESMGISRPTLRRWLDILVQTFMVRKLEPFESNVKKRLIKSPKIYVRDSGVLHTLLGIESFQDLLGNPILGNSWEGYCIENILQKFPQWKPCFYRTSNGAELDLVLTKGVKKIAFEFKTSLAPKVTKGFWNAVEDIQPDETWIIIPQGEMYPKTLDVKVSSLEGFLK